MRTLYISILKHSKLLLAVIVTFCCCRLAFFEESGNWVDGSWKWALDHAIHTNAIFGKDFIFTYGPLGFLSTRYIGANNMWALLAGDLLLAWGFFHLLYKIVPVRGLWWLPVIAATLLFRYANYSQALFVLFMIYAVAIAAGRADTTGKIIGTLYSVLLFFIKINYGFIALLFLLMIAVTTVFKERRTALTIVATAALSFLAICLCVRISLPGYIKYSLPLITAYDDAMFVPIKIKEFRYNAALYIMGITLLPVGIYMYGRIKKRSITPGNILVAILMTATCFLLYKNAFTRYDPIHYHEFFAAIAFFLTCTFLLIAGERSYLSLVTACSITVLCILNFALKEAGPGFTNEIIAQMLSPLNYYKGIAERIPDSRQENASWPTADVLPHFISHIRFSQLRYRGRPIPQSYSVYHPVLDSLNARHFIQQNRPDLVLIDNDAIDNRYAMWDEPVARAAIYLNYSITASKAHKGVTSTNKSMILAANKGAGIEPQLQKIATAIHKVNEIIPVPQSNEYPVYMSADVRYAFHGLLNKLILQPMGLAVILITDDGEYHQYRAVIPALKSPGLISHFTFSDEELEHFLTGNIASNKRIKGFILQTNDQGIEKDVSITFYHFKNYHKQL